MQKILSSLSEGLNLAVFLCMAALACTIALPAVAMAASSAQTQVSSAVSADDDASYLEDPASWTEGTIILKTDSKAIHATAALDVRSISSNRCFNVPAGPDGKPLVTLPAGFFDASGVTPGEIYKIIVPQDSSVFLASARKPITDSTVINYDCYRFTFAYKTKPVVSQ